MSGHSHWHSIKHQKSIADQKKGKMFSKIAKEISVAARNKGGNPETNSSLRIIIEKAKKLNMPKDTIEKAIKKGTGELKGEKLESFLIEALGPGNIAIMIEGITDNMNRTSSEIKQILNQNKGKFANEGSVKWMFERKGCIYAKGERESLELQAIESGAEDIQWQEDVLVILTKVDSLEKVREKLEAQGVNIEDSSIEWVAKDSISTPLKGECEKLFDALDENDGVQQIYSNLKE